MLNRSDSICNAMQNSFSNESYFSCAVPNLQHRHIQWGSGYWSWVAKNGSIYTIRHTGLSALQACVHEQILFDRRARRTFRVVPSRPLHGGPPRPQPEQQSVGPLRPVELNAPHPATTYETTTAVGGHIQSAMIINGSRQLDGDSLS